MCRIDETSGMLTLAKALNHDKAAILLFSVSVTDVNADVDFGDQSDVAQVIIYVQAYTDDEPIFTPNWSRARPIIKVEVAEEQDPGALILSLKAHDPITGILINHYQLVSEVSDASDERSDLFSTQDVIVADSESTSSFRDGDAISSLIALNPETGEISFKKRVDYEELENKVVLCSLCVVISFFIIHSSVIVCYLRLILIYLLADHTVPSGSCCRQSRSSEDESGHHSTGGARYQRQRPHLFSEGIPLMTAIT